MSETALINSNVSSNIYSLPDDGRVNLTYLLGGVGIILTLTGSFIVDSLGSMFSSYIRINKNRTGKSYKNFQQEGEQLLNNLYFNRAN